MKRSTVERVAGVRPVAVEGIFYRHAAVNRDAFAGGLHGRWGAHFPVIYLGRPEAAPVAEAYRHLVEEAVIPAHAVQPRVLYTVRVRAQDIVDLTDPANLDQVGLTDDDLTSVVDEYERCQAVSYTHLRAHETVLDLVCRLLLEKKKKKKNKNKQKIKKKK